MMLTINYNPNPNSNMWVYADLKGRFFHLFKVSLRVGINTLVSLKG